MISKEKVSIFFNKEFSIATMIHFQIDASYTGIVRRQNTIRRSVTSYMRFPVHGRSYLRSRLVGVVTTLTRAPFLRYTRFRMIRIRITTTRPVIKPEELVAPIDPSRTDLRRHINHNDNNNNNNNIPPYKPGHGRRRRIPFITRERASVSKSSPT